MTAEIVSLIFDFIVHYIIDKIRPNKQYVISLRHENLITIKLSNMKTKVLNLTKVFIAAVTISSCNNIEEPQVSTQEKFVEFNMTASALSRTTTTENGENLITTFAKNDEVGIFVYDSNDQPVLKNVKYTYDDNGWTSTTPIKVKDGESYNFYAYYPYDESLGQSADIKSLTLSASTVQKDGYDTSDVLIAKNETTATGTKNGENITVDLSYTHAFSMIEVDLTAVSSSLTAPTVTLKEIANSANINLTNNNTTTEEGKAEIIMNKQGENQLYRAVLPAQTIQKDVVFLEIIDGENVYEIRLKDNDITLSKGEIVKIGISQLQ